MRKVSVGNPQLNNSYRTQLASAYVSGTSLTVLSNESFAANDIIVAGEVGEELAEDTTVSSLTNKDTIVVGTAFNFDHPKDTPITKVAWNKIVLEGRSSSAGTFAEVETKDIQWDKLNTIFWHENGSDSWEYRFRFKNTVTGSLSDYSPTVTGAGFSRNQVGYMLRQVRQISDDTNGEVAGDRQIIRFFNKAQDIIRGVKKDWYFLRVEDSGITTVQSQVRYTLPTGIGDLGNVDDVRYRRVNGQDDLTYQLKYLPEKEFDLYIQDNNRTNNDDVEFYTLVPGDSDTPQGYIKLFPTPDSVNNTILVRYYRDMTDLDSVDDETLVPIPSLLEDFAIAQVAKLRGNEDMAQVYEGYFYGKQRIGRRVSEADVGINLLMKLDAARRSPAGQPLAMKRWLGRRGINRYYNNRNAVNIDYLRENYW